MLYRAWHAVNAGSRIDSEPTRQLLLITLVLLPAPRFIFISGDSWQPISVKVTQALGSRSLQLFRIFRSDFLLWQPINFLAFLNHFLEGSSGQIGRVGAELLQVPVPVGPGLLRFMRRKRGGRPFRCLLRRTIIL